MATKHGYYRGREVSILHYAETTEGEIQLPMLCQVRFATRRNEYYMNILSRKVAEGYRSRYLYLDAPRKLISLLRNFQKRCRIRLAMRRIRQRARASKIHEELVAAVWHPRKVEHWLSTGGWQLVAMIAGDEGLC